MKIVIIIPTYNEAANISELFARLSALALSDTQVLVVDDASPDGTAGVAETSASTLSVTVLRRMDEHGLGNALRAGMQWALNISAEAVVTMDADLSHAPEQLPLLLASYAQGADVVIGSRRVTGGSVVGWSVGRNLLSRCASYLSRTLLGLTTHDVTSGFRVYRPAFLRSFNLDAVRARGYAFQEEMVLRAERSGARVIEVPIHFVDRKAGVSKLSLIETVGSTVSLLDVRLGNGVLGWIGFVVLAAGALALRFAFVSAVGSEYDLWAFSWWAQESVTRSFFTFYGELRRDPILTFPNYALYLPLLAILGSAADATTVVGRTVLKIFPIAGDIILGAVIYGAMRIHTRARALLAAAFFLFHPLSWYISGFWGQTDVFHSLGVLLSVRAASRGCFGRAWCWFVFAIFFKLQAIALFPLILALHIRTVGLRGMWRALIAPISLAILITAPYAISSSFGLLIQSTFRSAAVFPVVSMNAWNPWFLLERFGHVVYDATPVLGPITYFHIGLLLWGGAVAAILHILPRRPSHISVVVAAGLLVFAFFLFLTEMHERYLYMFLPFAVFLIFEGLIPLTVAIIVSLLIFLNSNLIEPLHPILHFFATWGNGLPWIVINCAAFVTLFWWYIRRAQLDRNQTV